MSIQRIRDLKAVVDSCREGLKEKSGETVIFSDKGPVCMRVIDSLVEFLDSHHKRIDALERKVRELEQRPELA